MNTKEKDINNEIHIQEELVHEMEELKDEVHKQNSRPRIFWDGIVRGFGYAVGATVLFGLLVAILGFIARSTDIPWIEELIRWIGLID